MRRTYLASALYAFLLAGTAIATEPPVVRASASARAVVPADRARVEASVETHAPSAGDAAAQVRISTTSVLERVRALGLAAHVLQSTGYTVAPDLNYLNGTVKGYGARATLLIEVSDVARVGLVVDAVMSSGINEIRAIRFLSEREEEARATALRTAVAVATQRARVIAQAAGGQLGDLLEMSTEPPPNWHTEETITVAGERAGVAGTVLPPPEVEVSTVVYGSWRYVPPSK